MNLWKSVLTVCVGFSLLGCDSEPSRFNEQASLAQCDFEAPKESLELPVLLPAQPNWVVLGSSSAAGAGAIPRSESWANLLSSTYSTEVRLTNAAAGGYTTYQALSESCQVPDSRRQPDRNHNVDEALGRDADLVLVSFPSNDASVGYSAYESLDNLIFMQHQLATQGRAMMVLSSQPRNDIDSTAIAELKKLDRLLDEHFKACFVPVYDLLELDGRLNPDYDHDGVHLDNAGHRVVFEAVRERINSHECIYW